MQDDELCALAIVFEVATGSCRAGFAGEDMPRSTFNTLVGHTRQCTTRAVGRSSRSFYIGNQAVARRELLDLKNPVERGVVHDWDNMERIVEHMFTEELHEDPRDRPLFFANAPLEPKTNKYKAIEMFFETFNIPALFIAPRPVLSLYAIGNTTGIVVNIGEGVNHVLPVYKGSDLTYALLQAEISGAELTDHFMNLVSTENPEFESSFPTHAAREIARDMKEKSCYVASYYETEIPKKKAYTLPSGKTLTLGAECYKSSEIFFKPDLLGLESSGIPEMISMSVGKTNIEIREDFWTNIVLTGGTTNLPGFEARLRKELNDLVTPRWGIEIHGASMKKNSAWIGGSTLCCLPHFQESWIPSEIYDEYGPSVVHRYPLCF